MDLDELDIKILETIQRNGRITNQDLATEIGLSASPCWERLRRLERAGAIRAYRADLALDRIVRASVVFVEITLRAHEAHDFMRFERAIQAVPEVVECHATGGGFDYLLKVITTDIDHYQQLIEELLRKDVGIHRYFTYIVTKPIKQFSGYPLKQLLASGETFAKRHRTKHAK